MSGAFSRDNYLKLLSLVLTRSGIKSDQARYESIQPNQLSRLFLSPIFALLRRRDLIIARHAAPVSPSLREFGRDWPIDAETMIGMKRLTKIKELLLDLESRMITGHVLEAGTWRGGTSIFIRAVINSGTCRSRRLLIADSFKGHPHPDPRFPMDAHDNRHSLDYFKVDESKVRENFARYGVSLDNTEFISGWFSETLPKLSSEVFSLLVIDCDMYGSTIDVLSSLYPQVVESGFVVVCNFNLPGVYTAIQDYFHGIGNRPEFCDIDGSGVFWQVGAS